ncbi:hypothetical protein LINGRAHAP2_LOCUS15061 [Linum grandiflorum]
MPSSLFNRIMTDVFEHDPYFKQCKDAVGRTSFSPQQKLTSSFRMLAYGCSADSVDEYCRMGETTTLECLRKFCTAIITIYVSQYLRAPTVEDLRRLLDHSTSRGFPGMIGSIDFEDQPAKFGDELVANIEYDTNPDVTWDPPDHDTPTLMEYMARHNRIRDRSGHHTLRNDLVEHLWTKFGGE